MTDREIDDLLKSAPQQTDPALLANIEQSIRETLAPERPLPPSWILTAGLVALCEIIAAIGAGLLGFKGIVRLSFEQIGLIFSVLALFTILASSLAVAEMIPGSRRIANPRVFLAASVLAILASFALLFHDYGMSRFVPQGVACLVIGLLVALPAGLAIWLVLRRGFAVNAASAGLAAGTLAGLAGVITLELHCPIFHAMHVMVWHTAVIPVSAAGGALLGHLIGRK
jgi:hypothetical protein